MMLRRRCPSAAGGRPPLWGKTRVPSPSGPRCASSRVIAETRRSSSLPTKPQIPHISVCVVERDARQEATRMGRPVRGGCETAMVARLTFASSPKATAGLLTLDRSVGSRSAQDLGVRVCNRGDDY